MFFNVSEIEVFLSERVKSLNKYYGTNTEISKF